jgi:hypothetical protein
VPNAEGRTVTVEFVFGLISTCHPDKTIDTRPPYPMDYHFQSRAEKLEEATEVIMRGS